MQSSTTPSVSSNTRRYEVESQLHYSPTIQERSQQVLESSTGGGGTGTGSLSSTSTPSPSYNYTSSSYGSRNNINNNNRLLPPQSSSMSSEVERQRSPTIQERSQQILDIAQGGGMIVGNSNNNTTTTTRSNNNTLSTGSSSNSSSYPSSATTSSSSPSSYPSSSSSSSSNNSSSYVRKGTTTTISRTRNNGRINGGDNGLPSLSSSRSPSLISNDSSNASPYISNNNNNNNNLPPRYTNSNNNNPNGFFNYSNNNNNNDGYQRPPQTMMMMTTQQQQQQPRMMQPRESQASSFHSRISTTSRTTTTSAAAAHAMPQSLSRELNYTLPGAVRMNGIGTARRQDDIHVDDMTIDSTTTWLPSTSIVIQQGDSGRTMNQHLNNNNPAGRPSQLHAIVESVDDTGNGGGGGGASSTGGGGEQSTTTGGTTSSQFGGGDGGGGGSSQLQQQSEQNDNDIPTATVSAAGATPTTTAPKQQQKERCWHNRYIRIFLLGLISIIIGGGVFGIVFAIIHTKDKNNETDNNELVIQEIKSTMYPIFEQYGSAGQETITQIDIVGTPQNRAFQFMVDDPHIQNSILTPTKATTSFYSQERFVGRFSLATFYFSTIGESWTVQTRWLSYQSNECQWFGIVSSVAASSQNNNDEGGNSNSCFSKSYKGGDLSIDLRSNNLQGSVPIEIRYLETLKFLDLSDNMIVSIPLGQVFELPNLFGLALYDNQLHDDLRQMVDEGCSTSSSTTETAENDSCQTKYTGSKLRELTLGDNQYTGQLPYSISSLSNLVTLILEKNVNLGGTIPESYCNLLQLNVITVFDTIIEGEMPECFCNTDDDNDGDENHPFDDLKAKADCNSRLSDFSCSCCDGC